MVNVEHESRPEVLAQRFPKGFKWGFAASAYQIEGAASEDGRGPSIWDTFSHTPGKTAGGDTGDVACDHYHRYRDDVRLMAELSARAYRFSISWPRVMPTGSGKVNERGMDFYRRLVDELRAAGVEPTLNLFHWDLPQALQDRGGFANPDIVGWFGDFASLIASRLGDSVTDWMTFNEPAVYAFLAHADGIHAPGLRDWPTAIRVADNQIRAHAHAVDAIKAAVPAARIGVAVDINHFAPATDSAADARATEAYRATRDTWFLDPLFGRGYPALGIEQHRAAGHLEGVELSDPPHGRLDYVGVNYYRQETVHAKSDKPFDWEVRPRKGIELTEMEWEVVPEGLTAGLKWIHETYAPKDMIVSENGAAYPDMNIGPDGVVHDADRQSYLARHLAAAVDAIDAGVPLSGYFVWSLLDNFEWSLGYGKRFGVIRVDFETQRRTPKQSALWYRDLIAAAR
jgi:beta-glucosidase